MQLKTKNINRLNLLVENLFFFHLQLICYDINVPMLPRNKTRLNKILYGMMLKPKKNVMNFSFVD